MRISDWSSDVCSSDLGKGKSWGKPGTQKFIQIDIEPREMDSNVEIAAPVVGDIGSCVSALLEGMGDKWAPPPAEWTGTVNEKKEAKVAKMRQRLQNNKEPMDYNGELSDLRRITAGRRDVFRETEGDKTPRPARRIYDKYNTRSQRGIGNDGT